MQQSQTMTDSVMDNAKKLGGDLKKLSRDVYLAGMGVVATAEKQSKDTFDHMISAGKKYEKDQTRRVNRATGKVSDLAERLEDQVRRTVTSTLNRVGIPSRDEIQDLSKRVEQLTQKLDERG